MKLLPFLCIFLSLCHFGMSLDCYTCSVGEQDTDKTCVENPEQLTTTSCNKKYCTVIRQEYKDPQGKVVSIYRGCEDKPLHMNEIIEDETYRFYYTACQEKLCNGGTGKGGDATTGTGSLGDKSTLIVPGIGNGDIRNSISFPLISVFILIAHLF